MKLDLSKKNLLFACMLAICQVCWGQTLPQIEREGRLAVLESKDDTTKIKNLDKLSGIHLYLYQQYKRQENRDSMFAVAAEAMPVVDRLSTVKKYWKIRLLARLGELQCYVGDTVAGRRKLLNAAHLFAQNRFNEEELNCWRMLGSVAGYYGDRKQQRYYLKALESLALKYKKTTILVKTKDQLIDMVVSSGNLDTSKKLHLQLINDYKHTKAADLDYAFLHLASYYRYRGNLSQALFYGLAAQDWMVKTNDTTNKKKSLLYGELAEIYQQLGQPLKSIEWFKRTIDVRRKMVVKQEAIYRTAGFLLQEYIKLGAPREGLTYITKLAKDYPPVDGYSEANLWQMKAYCHEALGNFVKAEQAYLNMIKGYSVLKPEYEIMQVAAYDIANFYVKRKQYKNAALYIHPGDSARWSAGEAKNNHYLLFKIDSANRKYLSAIRHLNAFKSLNDSSLNAVKMKQIAELEIKYATDQKERDILALKKDQVLQSEKIKQAYLFRSWILIGVTLLIIVIGLLYHSFRTVRQKKEEIDVKNASLNKLIMEKDSLLEEKQWLIKEVHHRVKNNLQIVMGLLQRQSSFVNNKEALTAIRNSEYRMHAIALIHQRLYQSESLMLINMVDYINEMVGYLQECFDLVHQIRFEKEIADIDFEVNVAVPIGLILNEAITNAIKHACHDHQQCEIRISLQQTGEYDYLLEIADNGAGLSADFDLNLTNSMGFNLMRGLSKQLGGKLEWFNRDGLVVRTTCHIGAR